MWKIKENFYETIWYYETISKKLHEEYAIMVTSDGLADALFKIAQESGVTIRTKFIEGMFGAEDYNLVAAVPEDFLPKLKKYKIIGKVMEKDDCILQIENKKYYNYDELDLYDHFGG